jgi:hypothetical protein
MLSVRIDNKKESVMYAVALGCVFLLIIGVTWIYWSQSSGELTAQRGSGRARTMSGQTEEASSAEQQMAAKRYGESTTLWFFGTLVILLILLFGLTFRYYSYREMKEAERKWRMACQQFLTRMEIEQIDYEEKRGNGDTVWAKMLNGEGVKESEIAAIPMLRR